MAVSRKESVILSTADADTIAGPLDICGIKVVGGASGMTVNLKSDQLTGGTVLYTATVGNSTEKHEQVILRASGGVYVNISAGGGTVYIYLEP
jgi:hypothetical protein